MRINHNISAINTYSRLSTVSNRQSKALEKLSSGMRINRSSDDAAGLAISEKMRAQIRGLNQSSRNIQDAISLVQTAEGGMNEVHELLQRGRELAVQASNATYTTEDKNNIQAEIDSILNEIDRIAESTEFNKNKLLNEADLNKTAAQSVIDGLKSGWLDQAASLIQTYYGLTASTRDLTVNLVEGTAGGTLAYVKTSWSVSGDAATLANLGLHIELADFAPSTGENGENTMTQSGGTLYNDRIIAHEMVHAIMADAMGDDFYDMPTWFKEGTAEFIHGADDRLEADVAANGGVQNILNRAVDLINGAVWAGDSKDYSASYLAVKYISSIAGDANFKNIISAIDDDDNLTDNTIGSIIANTPFADLDDLTNDLKSAAVGGGIDYYNSAVNIDAGAGETDTGSIGGSDHAGGALSPEAVVPTGVASDNPTNLNVIFPSTSSTGGTLGIQLGANKSQRMTISLASVKTKDLGIDDIDVVNNANESITKFDDAIVNVATNRAKFGAVQNRLEHALKANVNSSENLQSSESRIRDADMAEETMIFTKSNILNQAAIAMLSQANQSPESVLRLLS